MIGDLLVAIASTWWFSGVLGVRTTKKVVSRLSIEVAFRYLEHTVVEIR